MTLFRWTGKTPGTTCLRVRGLDDTWIEFRPKLGVWDVVQDVGPGYRIIAKRLLRTDDLFAAISCLLRVVLHASA